MATLIEFTGGWPFKCQRQKSKTGPEAVKQKLVRDYLTSTYFVSKQQSQWCVSVWMWSVHKRVDGLLRAGYRNPAWVWNPGMSASIPSCTGLSCVISVKEKKKSWVEKRHHEVILVSGCRDWWQGLTLRQTMLSNPCLHWAEIQEIWKVIVL